MESEIASLPEAQLWGVAILAVLLLLFGYRIKKVGFFVVWFLIGWNVTTYFLPSLAGALPEVASTEFFSWLVPLCGGLLLALVGLSVEKICVAGASFALIIMITIQYFGTDIQTILAGAIVGVFAAGAAVMMMKPATILVTSVGGAYFLTLALINIFPAITMEAHYWPILALSTAVGAGVQFITTKHV